MTTEFDVQGMTCNHCVMSVKGALKKIDGLEDVNVDLQTGHVVVTHQNEIQFDLFKETVEDQGYDVP